MTVKIYDLGPYWDQLRPIPDGIPLDEHIRNLGFTSCKFVVSDKDSMSTYWLMDRVEFTWFAIKFSR
jgi:hypothetical protein